MVQYFDIPNRIFVNPVDKFEHYESNFPSSIRLNHDYNDQTPNQMDFSSLFHFPMYEKKNDDDKLVVN